MNGKVSQSIQLPKEIIRAERARSNKLLLIAIFISNFLLYLIMRDDLPDAITKKKAVRKMHSVITLKVDNYVPATIEEDQQVSLMKKNTIVARNCFLKKCHGEKCTLEVPSSKVYALMRHSTTPFKLIPHLSRTKQLSKEVKREFTI
ncbi:MAG: hypothetical protein KAG61_06675 [Bacteriovoracaceae bacterium]|nr:hypothetical protein [Bacteriovoracaceae bacterium]